MPKNLMELNQYVNLDGALLFSVVEKRNLSCEYCCIGFNESAEISNTDFKMISVQFEIQAEMEHRCSLSHCIFSISLSHVECSVSCRAHVLDSGL